MSVNPIQAMPTRQYKGMRYVPIFDGNWDNTKDYDPLTIVSYQGNSYTSRTFVPAGTDLTNEDYWALTGNYNAQVEAYRQEVHTLDTEVDNLKFYVTPYMFGALGDDSHNDTNAIQDAIDYAASNNMNVVIPKGTFKITATLNIPQSTILIGTDKNNSTLKWYGPNGDDFIKVNGHFVEFHSLNLIEHNFTAEQKVPNSTSICINATGYSNLSFIDLKIKGFRCGINLDDNCWESRVLDCVFNSVYLGITARLNANNINIERNVFNWLTTGLSLAGCNAVNIFGNVFESCDDGIIITNKSDCHIFGNYFEFNSNSSILISWGQQAVNLVNILNNRFYANDDTEFIKFHGAASTLINVINNAFYGSFTATKNCLTATHLTYCLPLFERNYLASNVVIGRSPEQLADYYKIPSKHRQYVNTSDLSNCTNEMGVIGIEFNSENTIVLPDARAFSDPHGVIDVLASSSSANDDAQMLISDYLSDGTTPVRIVGKNYIIPNTLYHIYFNRITEGALEYIVAK